MVTHGLAGKARYKRIPTTVAPKADVAKTPITKIARCVGDIGGNFELSESHIILAADPPEGKCSNSAIGGTL